MAQRRRLRRRVLGAATELFAERGLHQVDMAAICERTGMTMVQLHEMFASKEEIFDAALEWERLTLLRSLISPIGNGTVTKASPDLAGACSAIVSHLVRQQQARRHSVGLVFTRLNVALTTGIRGELRCLLRLTVEQSLRQYLPPDRGMCERVSAHVIATWDAAVAELEPTIAPALAPAERSTHLARRADSPLAAP